METLDEAIVVLRAGYLREAPLRLEELTSRLEHVSASPADPSCLAELRRAFHSLRGSGRTYGLPDVSAVARQGDVRAREAAEAGGATPADLQEWRELVAKLREAFARPDFGSGGAATLPGSVTASAAVPRDVLVVDDDDPIRKLLASLFSHQGYTVRTAGTLAEGQAALHDHLPDVAIIDVVLPDGTGFELIEHLRALPGGETPGVVVLSVRATFADRVDAVHCGADAHFEQPVDWDALSARVRQMMEARTAAPARVLSVEDDPQQAVFLRTVLESGGCEVRVCADPAHFATDLIAFRPDLVLMDGVLPGMSGYDLVRYLRQDEQHATLPVLMLSSESRVEARIKATRAGADDFLTKPVSPGLLLSAVAARIERARFVRSLIERDGLTRLLTHSAFIARARAALLRHQRNPSRPLVWVMLDVDHFKSVNDRFGHPTGDRVLLALANHLRQHLRESDSIGRYGGEEVALLLEDLDEADALRLVSRLREEFASTAHRAPDGSPFHVTFSGGIALLTPGATLDAWRAAADGALYAAKRSGRNRAVLAPQVVDETPTRPVVENAA